MEKHYNWVVDGFLEVRLRITGKSNCGVTYFVEVVDCICWNGRTVFIYRWHEEGSGKRLCKVNRWTRCVQITLVWRVRCKSFALSVIRIFSPFERCEPLSAYVSSDYFMKASSFVLDEIGTVSRVLLYRLVNHLKVYLLMTWIPNRITTELGLSSWQHSFISTGKVRRNESIWNMRFRWWCAYYR